MPNFYDEKNGEDIVSPTINNYLHKWDDRNDPLIRELCEKVYQMKIDMDELLDNQNSRINDRITKLEKRAGEEGYKPWKGKNYRMESKEIFTDSDEEDDVSCEQWDNGRQHAETRLSMALVKDWEEREKER